MRIDKATNNDNEILTEITKKSKAFWGYSEQQIIEWNDALTISKEYFDHNFVYNLIDDHNQIIGYYSYFNIENDTVKLDNMFLLPDNIGNGLGKYLMTDFIQRIKNNIHTKRIILDSEPNAELFYQKMGFVKIGEFETSIKNRFMPIMEMKL